MSQIRAIRRNRLLRPFTDADKEAKKKREEGAPIVRALVRAMARGCNDRHSARWYWRQCLRLVLKGRTGLQRLDALTDLEQDVTPKTYEYNYLDARIDRLETELQEAEKAQQAA